MPGGVEDPAGRDRPAFVRTEDARRRLARRVIGAGDPASVLVVVQNSVVRDRGRPPGRAGLRVVSGSHDRHPGLYLGYVTDGRCGFVDRELHLPRSLFRSLPQRTVAGLPDGLEYATPPQLVMRMLTRALEDGARAQWLVTGPGLGGNWPLRALIGLRGLGMLAELTAEEADAELAGGELDAVEGQVVDGHVWAVARRRAQRQDGSWLVLRHRLADRADRTMWVCRHPGGADLATVLRLAAARRLATEAFAEVRRQAAELRGAAAGGPDDGSAAPPDPWTAWYDRVTRAMAAQADSVFGPVERSG